MKRLITALWVCAVAIVAAYADDKVQPVFHKFSFDDNGIIIRMSDNGLWAVAQPGMSDDQKSGRAKLVDLSKDNDNWTQLQTDNDVTQNGACSVSDVTDDGNIVVGSYADMPAYWNKTTGEWTKLPIPDECSGGEVSAVTPDGKYAVGLCTYDSNEYWQRGVMWNLTTNTIVELPNVPTLDMTHEDQHQYKFTHISADGRYVLAMMSHSYVQPAAICSYVYDRQNDTYKFIGFTESDTRSWTPDVTNLLYVDNTSMSTDGLWVTGMAYMVTDAEEYEAPFAYNVKTDKFEVYDEEESHGMLGISVDNEGTVYSATPSSTPLRTWSVRYNGYWYDFSSILTQTYGIDFYAKTGYDYTGTPWALSDDAKKIAVMVDPTCESYIVDMPVKTSELCAGINLLGNYTISPADGGTFTTLTTVNVTFDRSLEVLGERNSVKLKDAEGNTVSSSIGCAVSNANAQVLVVTFFPVTLDKGATYTVEIPAGTVCLANDELKTNEAITITYTGRGTQPVAVTQIYPEDGSELAKIDASTSPVLLTFDANVVVTDTASASLLYEDGTVYSTLNLLASGNRVAVYPASQQNLYLNNNYKVVVSKGAVTDITGSGANEEITINYVGTYERQLSTDDETLFEDDFSNPSQSYNNFLRYDGDKLTPTTAMAAWNFDAENTPWYFNISDDDNTSDFCAGSHSMYTPAGKSDDWMVIPQLSPTDENCSLSFYAQSYLKSKEDRLKVYIWENEEVLTRLTDDIMTRFKAEAQLVFDEQLSPGEKEDVLAGDWQHYTVSLADYAGKSIYIAFVNDNEDQSAVFVDSIKVKRNMKYLLSLTNDESVVAQTSIPVAGSLTVNSDDDTYTSVTLTLKDSDGNTIDEVSETGLSLKKGDKWSFAFTKELPLVAGETNKFSINVKLDDYTDVVSSSIKNLAFRPEKRVVLEEITGTTCPNCPQGILAIEKLEETYGDRFIPISIHTYNGDQMGSGLSGYTEALGLSSAPSGIVNRNGIISYPMRTSPLTGDYVFSFGGSLWTDYVAQEMEVPADADIDAEVVLDEANGTFDLPVTVKYALNAKSLNLNLFVVVMEDGINSYQQNNFSSITDPAFGEWGQGGLYGSAVVYNYTHNDVVRSYYGNINGTGGFLPQAMTAGTEYTATIEDLTIPESINHLTKTKAVVMLIDANTETLINSVCVKFPGYETGISGVEESATRYTIGVSGGEVTATGDGEATLSLYTTAGVMLGQAKGSGNVTVSAGGYHGAVIARVVSKSGTVVKKIAVR